MLLTKGIREALRDAAALEPEVKARGASTKRIRAIDSVVAHAKKTHPELFFTDVVVDGMETKV